MYFCNSSSEDPIVCFDLFMNANAPLSSRNSFADKHQFRQSFIFFVLDLKYIKLSNIQNPALQERLLWKISFLEKEIKDYAIIKLAYKIKEPELRERLINVAKSSGPEYYKRVLDIIENRNSLTKK